MNATKHLICLYGVIPGYLRHKLESMLDSTELIYDKANFVLYENRIYDTGLPDKPVTYKEVSLYFHGILFPKSCSIDSLAVNREVVFKNLISDHLNDISMIPLAISNGSYVGIAIDHRLSTLYAYTSFLNSIPFYYAQIERCIILCTDLVLLAKTLRLSLSLTYGTVEYYVNGTNLSSLTAFDEVKCIPKGAVLRFCDDKIETDYYYVMPTDKSENSFSDNLDLFSKLWKRTLALTHSTAFRYGLGLTGGIDSRLIFAALPDRRTPLLYTGSHPLHPDVQLAKHITTCLGYDNHIIEDYSGCDKITGYAEYCSISDNPYHCSNLHFHQQMRFRSENKLIYEFSGLTEFLGGVYHYSDRRSLADSLRMSLPLVEHELKLDSSNILRLLSLGLRNSNLSNNLSCFPRRVLVDYQSLQLNTFKNLIKQIGEVRTTEAFLERFRHIHKMANLLSWVLLPGRRYNEHLSPSMNIEMTDFACRVPLPQRDSRRLLLAYLKKYHPDLAKFVISSYMFSAESPWVLYKLLAPNIKVLNHLGLRIPHFQWYIMKNNYKSLSSETTLYRLQREVCRSSDIIMNTEFATVLKTHGDHKICLMRMYNMALLEKKMSMNEDELFSYLCALIDKVK